MVPPAISRRRNRANLDGTTCYFREPCKNLMDMMVSFINKGTKDTVRPLKADGAGKNDESEGLSRFNGSATTHQLSKCSNNIYSGEVLPIDENNMPIFFSKNQVC